MRRRRLDQFAAWLCARRLTWGLAESGFMSARLIPLCIASAMGVDVRWEHLTGRVSINDACDRRCHAVPGEGYRHG